MAKLNQASRHCIVMMDANATLPQLPAEVPSGGGAYHGSAPHQEAVLDTLAALGWWVPARTAEYIGNGAPYRRVLCQDERVVGAD